MNGTERGPRIKRVIKSIWRKIDNPTGGVMIT